MLKYVLCKEGHDIVTKIDTDTEIPKHLYPYLTVVESKVKTETKALRVAWEIVFHYVNEFFMTMSKEDQATFVQMFVHIRHKLHEFIQNDSAKTATTLPPFFKQIGDIITVFGRETNIMKKLLAFVKAYPIQFDNVVDHGNRAQDKTHLTVTDPEMQQLLACIMFSKMVSPLFTVILNDYGRLPDFATDTKEAYIMCLVVGLYEEMIPDLLEKIHGFIEHYVYRDKKSSDTRRIMEGATAARTTESLYATILVRPFVNINLGESNNNPMRYIDAVIKRRLKRASTIAFSVRTPELFQGDDTDNKGAQEWNSAVSRKPLHVPIISQVAVKQVLAKYTEEYHITQSEVSSIENFYRMSLFDPNSISKICLRAIFGKQLGGAESISYLKFEQYMQLVVIAQIIALDFGCKSLAHTLTTLAGRTSVTKSDINATKLRCGFDASPKFRDCMDKFTIVPDSFWRQGIEACIMDIVNTRFIYNTSPVLWENLGETNLNGQTIPVDPTIATQLYVILEHYL